LERKQIFGRQKIDHIKQLLFVLDVIINTVKTDYLSTDIHRPFTDNKVLYFSAKVLGSAVAQYWKIYRIEYNVLQK